MHFFSQKKYSFSAISTSLLAGFFIASISNVSLNNTPDSSHLEIDHQSLEKKMSHINNSINHLIKQKTANLNIESNPINDESITQSNLKIILKEIIHEELNETIQENIADNEDTSRVWELINQAQETEVSANLFQSKEINTLPAKQKEMVISEIVGMMNRGEIDIDQFFSVK